MHQIILLSANQLTRIRGPILIFVNIYKTCLLEFFIKNHSICNWSVFTYVFSLHNETLKKEQQEFGSPKQSNKEEGISISSCLLIFKSEIKSENSLNLAFSSFLIFQQLETEFLNIPSLASMGILHLEWKIPNENNQVIISTI